MNRFIKALVKTSEGLIKAISRFPLTSVCLTFATVVACYMISLHAEPSLFVQKLLFTFGLGAFLGVATQFACERFPRLKGRRPFVYLIAMLLIFGYYMIIASAPSIDYAVRARTIVAIIAMFCLYIWLPSYQGKEKTLRIAEFNQVALTHFKAAFTSILYSAVLAAGISSILAAVDILLFRINQDWFGYTMAFVWISFATTYYLSRLPRFHAEGEEDLEFERHATAYPKFLKILVSYIVIPLIAAYSLVLFAYFGKILITIDWPSGQLGPMILAYSIVGLISFVLASPLEDNFAAAYRLIFPKVLILMVIMQLVSVSIRLSAYGVTEGRYYLALFGGYSLICGVILSLRPVKMNFMIALLGAGMAIVSVIPPVDAFTVSRNAQIDRLEQMLQAEGVLVGGAIQPKPDASLTLRQETTSILNYLERRNYLRELAWLPEVMKPAVARPYAYLADEKMKEVFGFEPAYESMNPDADYFYAGLNFQKPFDISGYDVFMGASSYRNMPTGEEPSHELSIQGKPYTVKVVRLSDWDARVSVRDQAGKEIIGTDLYEYAKNLSGVGNQGKEALDAEAMSIHVTNNGYRLKVIFQMVNLTFGGNDAGGNYDVFILLGVPEEEGRG